MTCFQRRHTDGQQAHEKMLNITDHQRKANQNHNELPPHTYWLLSKRQQITVAGEDVGTLVHCWWECKSVQPLWRTVQRFLKK